MVVRTDKSGEIRHHERAGRVHTEKDVVVDLEFLMEIREE